MSPRLVLQFLGLPQLHLDDQPIATDRRKAIALLAYLAVNDLDHGSQRYSRESLSALLWPDYEQAKAFSNLRRTIWEVHQSIGEGWLIAERETVSFNPEAGIDLDVARFQHLLSQSKGLEDREKRIPLLVEAAQLINRLGGTLIGMGRYTEPADQRPDPGDDRDADVLDASQKLA